METAESEVTAILQEILLQASEQPVDAVDFRFVVRYMNRYMNELAVTVPLGYTNVDKPTDIITIPAGAINGLIFNVALRVLNSFDIQVGQTLYQNAESGLKAMRKLSRNLSVTRHPSTLPLGSGNDVAWSGDNQFYYGESADILTEQDGDILLEGVTNEQ